MSIKNPLRDDWNDQYINVMSGGSLVSCESREKGKMLEIKVFNIIQVLIRKTLIL